jgi:hypothetical protein
MHPFRERARRRPRASWLWTRPFLRSDRGRQARLRERSARELATVAAAAVAAGVALEFFLDPRSGRRRRHLFRDRTTAAFRRRARLVERHAHYEAGKVVVPRFRRTPDRNSNDANRRTGEIARTRPQAAGIRPSSPGAHWLRALRRYGRRYSLASGHLGATVRTDYVNPSGSAGRDRAPLSGSDPRSWDARHLRPGASGRRTPDRSPKTCGGRSRIRLGWPPSESCSF